MHPVHRANDDEWAINACAKGSPRRSTSIRYLFAINLAKPLQQDTWYHRKISDTEVVVELLPRPRDRYWLYEELCQRPLDGEGMEGTRVLVRGRAPVWMYAYVAAVAVSAGARAVAVFQPQQEGSVDVYPLAASHRDAPRWFDLENRGHSQIVEFVEMVSGDNWSVESVSDATRLERNDATTGWPKPAQNFS